VTHRVDALDPVFVAFSRLGTVGAIWILFALAGALLWRRPQLFAHVTATVLVADLLALGLKQLTGRRRPFLANPGQEPLLGTPLDLSLPSGHAATSFAGATILALAHRRSAVPLFVLAALVAWSRVYVGVHYPLDIVAGALLGVGVALVSTAIWRRLPWLRRAAAPERV
jgi:undecaprenyl-diphosphatase